MQGIKILLGTVSSLAFIFSFSPQTQTTQATQGPLVNLIARRAGNHFGQIVPENVESSNNPANFVVLLNDDREENLPGFAKDNSNTTAMIPSASAIDDDLVQIGLHKPVALSQGTLEIVLSNPSAVHLFTPTGQLLTDYSVNLASPSGQLTALAAGSISIWLEGVQANPDFVFTFQYRNTSGQVVAKDTIHIALVEASMVDASNEKVDLVPTLPKDTLVALGSPSSLIDQSLSPGNFKPVFHALDVGPLPSAVLYELHFNAMPALAGTSVLVESTTTGDSYLDVLNFSAGMAESAHSACLYESDLAGDEVLLTSAERSAILQTLNLQAVHFAGARYTLTTPFDSFTRPLGAAAVTFGASNTSSENGSFVVEFDEGAQIELSSQACTPTGGLSSWNFVSIPPEATVQIVGSTSSSINVAVDRIGYYEVQLVYIYDGVPVTKNVSFIADSSLLCWGGEE